MAQFIRFGAVGVLNTLVHYLVFLLLFRVFEVPVLLASALGYFAGVINSFLLNRRWTFKVSGNHRASEFMKFLLVNFISLGVNLAVLALMIDRFAMLPEVAQVIAIMVSLVVNFLGNRLWTFRESGQGTA